MKKIVAVLLTLIMLLGLSVGVVAEEATALDISIYVDGELVELDTTPVVKNNRTLVPIRGVFEKLGASVDWNQKTQEVIVKDDSMELLLEVGNEGVLVNGEIDFLDTESLIMNDRTLVPIRFIAESLGYEVIWNGDDYRIDINTVEETVEQRLSDQLPTVDSKEALLQLLSYSERLNNYYYSPLAVEIGFDDLVELDGGDFDVVEEARDEATNSMDDAKEADMAPEAATSDMAEASALAEDDYSGTNNQEEGVDEADLIKTDGQYIYYVNDNVIRIFNADPSAMEEVATIEVEYDRGYVNDLYIEDNNLIVIGTSYTMYAYPEGMVEEIDNPLIPYPTVPDVMPVMEDATIDSASGVDSLEGTDGFISESYVMPYYNTTNTLVLVYDLEDISAPELVKDMDFEGYLVSSRLVGDDLYVVTNKSVNMYYYNDYEPYQEYQIKPKYADNLTDQVTVLDYDEIHYFPDYVRPNIITTVGMDLASDKVEVESYLGYAENVYATTESLYLTFTNYEYSGQVDGLRYVPEYSVNTSVYGFGMDNGSLIYENKGKVPGTVVDQFSFNEYNGDLRIATTTGNMWDDTSENNLYILDENLELKGALTGLAPGEKIYSTRFANDRVYMVTFKQIDPFFVIDASDPTEPVVLGQLKIPGFSTYMHVLGDNHVLGFGQDTVEESGFTSTGGFKISLFDVTGPTNPVEKQKEVIGVSGTYSELLNNHKALMISLSKGLMGFPISVASNTPYATDFRGAYVYDLTTEDFSFRGRITHMKDDSKYDYGDSIQRVIYIGDYLYTLSGNEIKATSIETMETVGSLEFE